MEKKTQNKTHFVAFQKTNRATINFLFDNKNRILNASGKTIKLVWNAGRVLETKSNTASATDHSASVFVLSVPACTGTAGFLSPFPILRLQGLLKSMHLIYIRGVFQRKDLSLSALN